MVMKQRLIATIQVSSPPAVVRKSFLLRDMQPQAAYPATKADASGFRRRGIRRPNMYQAIPEPTEPEYFLESFPRDAFPVYLWTERPENLPTEAWTTETTHRDGQQGGLPLSTEQSLKIYD